MKSSYYTIFFWLIWLLTIQLVLKIIPNGCELIFIVIYSIIGVTAYISIPSVIRAYIDKIEEKKYKNQQAIKQNKKIFLKEQCLRRKYRYLKLNNKENIINSNIDINDKILLLNQV